MKDIKSIFGIPQRLSFGTNPCYYFYEQLNKTGPSLQVTMYTDDIDLIIIKINLRNIWKSIVLAFNDPLSIS